MYEIYLFINIIWFIPIIKLAEEIKLTFLVKVFIVAEKLSGRRWYFLHKFMQKLEILLWQFNEIVPYRNLTFFNYL